MSNCKKLVLVAWLGALSLVGCNRAFYRQQADQEVACMIAEKSNDPRWAVPGFSIQMDPRSRYYDPHDPDAQPMPEDDPASHRFMHCVDGKKGWPKWHQNGTTYDLENPGWRDHIGEYAPLNDNGDVILSLDSAVRLAYIHSPDYQNVLETVYLSALDVTTERFRFDTQFFGGTDSTFRHLGRLRPGGDSNTLTQDSDLELRRRFATAGELMVGFANQFVWQFAGPNANTSVFSLLNFSLVQPLLRGAGRDIALEQLTIAERALLANLRAYTQWRQGFFSDVAIGESGVQAPRRRGGFFGGTGLSGFTGQGSGGFGGVGAATGFGRGGGGGGAAGGAAGGGFAGGGVGNVGGFLGLLQTTQQIRNSQASLNLQIGTLNLLESSLDAGIIDLTQVDQFRQSIETSRAALIQSENGLKDSLEFYKIGTLGLPPDLPVALDDALIQPFQLIETATTELQDAITAQQAALGITETPTPEEMDEFIAAAKELQAGFALVDEAAAGNLRMLDTAREQRERTMTEEERLQFHADVDQLTATLESLRQRFSALVADREQIEQNATPNNTRDSADLLVIWLRELLGIVQEMSLVQARAKVEAVAVDPIDMDASRAFEIALANRLDIMNNRASLVDTWRLIQFNADALQSNLDVFFDGDLQTVGDNPLNFRGQTGSLRAGLRFDAPFTRLLERNNYRQQLIEYQQARRELIQSFDNVFLGLRSRLRNLDQLRVNLEIQRRATVIAIRRVDSTREDLNEPQPPAQPGEPASQLGPTAATNLLTALNDLQSTQDAFMSVYLAYYANRMLLNRDLGTMILDEAGRWVEGPLEGAMAQADMAMGMDCLDGEVPLIPPPLPESLQEIIDEEPAEMPPPPEPSVQFPALQAPNAADPPRYPAHVEASAENRFGRTW